MNFPPIASLLAKGFFGPQHSTSLPFLLQITIEIIPGSYDVIK